jgi:hypothetical protein
MVNVASIIEVESSKAFAAYAGKRIKQKNLLEEIRNAAMGATLAEGGNDKMFDKAWKASLENLKLRYLNEIKSAAPKTRKVAIDFELLSQEAVDFVDAEKSKIKGNPKVLYLMIAEQGITLAYVGFLDGAKHYRPLLRLGQTVFKTYNQRFVPGMSEQLGDNRCFAVIQQGTREDFNLVPLDQITADLDELVTSIKRLMAGMFAVQVIGSRQTPLTRFPTVTKIEAKPFTPSYKKTVDAPEGRTTPLSPNDADERIRAIETKYAAKLPRGLSPYQRDVAKWILTGSGNAFVEAVAGSGKSTTLLYCAELMADYGGNKIMVSFNKNIASMNLAALTSRGVLMQSLTLNSLGNATLPSGKFSPGNAMTTKYKKIAENDVMWKDLQAQYGTNLTRDSAFALTKSFAQTSEDGDEDESGLEDLAIDTRDPRVILAATMIRTCAQWTKVIEDAVGIVSSTLVDPTNVGDFYSTLEYYNVDLKPIFPKNAPARDDDAGEDGGDGFSGGTESFDGVTTTVEDIVGVTYTDSEGNTKMVPIEVVKLARLVARTLAIGRQKLVSGVKGFIDQNYWPGLGDPLCRYPQYSLMFVDEAQDLSNCNIELIKRCLAPGGRVIFVGDRAQAIYGFRGADTQAMSNVIREFECDILPLSTCYRCDRAIIAAAQQYVPQIEATPWAKEGEIVEISRKQYIEMVDEKKGPKIGDLILCRRNAPLAIFAMRVLKRGTPVKIIGREDFLKEVKAAFGSIMRQEDYRFREFYSFAQGYVAGTLQSAEGAKGKDKAKLEAKADCAEFLAEVWLANFEGPEDKRFRNERLFKDFLYKPDGLIVNDPNKTTADFKREAVVACSIHKSKGDEAPNVWWIGPQLELDSPQDWQKLEEQNLKYVATTRAEHRLIKISYPEDEPSPEGDGDSDGE